MCVIDETDNAAQLLRSHGLRVTGIRLAILDLVAQTPHADADTIRTGVMATLGSVSIQAVYDTLHALVRAGLLRRIEPAHHPALFALANDDSHDHLVCRGCGLVVDIARVAGHPPCLDVTGASVTGASDVQIDEAEVIYWGLCQTCAVTPPHTTARA